MTTDHSPRTALVFPGQGSQTAGMGQDLVAASAAARNVYERASGVLGYDLLRACLDEHGELSDPTVVQPAVLTHALASWRALDEVPGALSRVVAVAGHSLGEISALVCAGVLDLERAVSLVARRARLMAGAEAGGMRVVFGPAPDEVRRVCATVSRPGHVVTLANVNSSEQTVISGHRPALAAAGRLLVERSAVVRELDVAVAPHSPLMEPVTADYAAAVREAAPGDGTVPVVSSLDGVAYRTGDEAATRLVGQLTGCVSWPKTLDGLREHAVEVVVELGPKTVLRDLTREAWPRIPVLVCGTAAAVAAAGGFLTSGARRTTGARVDRRTAESFLTGCLRLAVGTPSPRHRSQAEFTEFVRAPYEELARSLDEVRAVPTDGPGTVEAAVVAGAARRILSALEAKGVDEALRKSLVDGLAGATGTREEVLTCLL
ncbi:ACP S-malonyltransferase [Streptomyces sp. JNUCC 64]